MGKFLMLGVAFISLWYLGCSKKDSGSSCDTCATCPAATAAAGGDCGCGMIAPFDLSAVNTTGFWPYGVHGGGHPEGHRGWDFTATTALKISAPAAGTVVQFDSSVKDEDPSGYGVYVKLDCGVIVSFQPMRPDTTIAVGTKVTQGQLLGVMSPVFGNCCTVHFDTRALADDGTSGAVCSTPFMPAATVTKVTSLLATAAYGEKVARTSTFTCKTGTQSFSLPAEPLLCNVPTTGTLHDSLVACLPLANGVTVY